MARGAKERREYQVVRDGLGRVVQWQKQVTVRPADKANGIKEKRTWVRSRISADDMRAKVQALQAIVSQRREGILTPAEVDRRTAVERRGGGYAIHEAWRVFRLAPHHSAGWTSKLRGMELAHVTPFFRARRVEYVHELTAQVMAEWCAWLSKRNGAWGRPLALATVQNIYHQLIAVVRYAIEGGHLDALPWGAWRHRVPIQERRRAVGVTKGGFESAVELGRGLDVARSMAERSQVTGGGLPDLVERVGVMVLLGLRRGEAIALSWEHIRRSADGSGIVVRIEHAAKEGWRRGVAEVPGELARPMSPTKTGDTRVIEASATGPLAALLGRQKALLQERGMYRPDGPVFPDSTGRYRARDVVSPEVMRAIAQRAGLTRAGRRWDQHSTRHSGVRMSIAGGATVDQVMAFAGHKDLQTTKGYFGDMHRHAARNVADSSLAAYIASEAAKTRPLLALEHSAELDLCALTSPLHAERLEPSPTQAERERGWKEKYLGRKLIGLAQHLDVTTDKVPKAVTNESLVAYRRAYNRARKDGLTMAEQRERGQRARSGILGAYRRMWCKATAPVSQGAPGLARATPEEVEPESERRAVVVRRRAR